MHPFTFFKYSLHSFSLQLQLWRKQLYWFAINIYDAHSKRSRHGRYSKREVQSNFISILHDVSSILSVLYSNLTWCLGIECKWRVNAFREVQAEIEIAWRTLRVEEFCWFKLNVSILFEVRLFCGIYQLNIYSQSYN